MVTTDSLLYTLYADSGSMSDQNLRIMILRSLYSEEETSCNDFSYV